MQIAQVIGGYSLGGADLLRRAMGKKLPEEMAKHRETFVAGAARNGVAERRANELFDLMEKFAGYGFNKSHAAAYAVLAYQTAYLKAHYPAEFMAATLSADMDNTDKVQLLVEDAVANGLQILPPDINRSEYRFIPVAPPSSLPAQVEGATLSSLPKGSADITRSSFPSSRGESKRGVIRYGLGAIKGTGRAAIERIVEARRSGGPFTDLFDFCYRVDKRLVNRRVIESLIRAGAFDSLDRNRAKLLATVGAALESAEQASRSALQVSLFGDLPAPGIRTGGAEVPPWSERERLQNEKLALGFYLSGHPFRIYEPEVREFVSARLDRLAPQPGLALLAGIVHSMRTQMTRRGRMAVITLDDGSARVEMTVFNELFERHRHWLREDELLIVEGKVTFDEFSGSLRVSAENLYDLQAARNRFARAIRLHCNGESSSGRLRELLEPYRNGNCPVSIVYANRGAACEIALGEAWRVSLHDELIRSLSDWLEPQNVEIVYQSPRAG